MARSVVWLGVSCGSECGQPDGDPHRERQHDQCRHHDRRIDPASRWTRSRSRPGRLVIDSQRTRRWFEERGFEKLGFEKLGFEKRGLDPWGFDRLGLVPTVPGAVRRGRRVRTGRVMYPGRLASNALRGSGPGHCGVHTFHSSPDFCRLMVTVCGWSGLALCTADTSTTACSPSPVSLTALISSMRTSSSRALWPS